MTFAFEQERRRLHFSALHLLCGAALLAGCTESRPLAPAHSPGPEHLAAPANVSIQVACEMTFLVTVTDDDPAFVPLGLPSTWTENTSICETWVGNDYVHYSLGSSTSDDVSFLPEQAVGAKFSSGTVVPTTASGVPIQSTASVDPTEFDFLDAEQSLRDASFANPYYGVYAGCQPPEVVCQSMIASGGIVAAFYTDAELVTLQAPSGIQRRGVVELLRGSAELSALRDGMRVFRRTQGSETRIWTVDPVTQLIVREQYTSPDVASDVRHSWRRTRFGFVKTASYGETTERRGDQALRSRTTIQISNMRIRGVPVD